MTVYVKVAHSKGSDKGKHYHWRTDCPDYPKKEIDTILTYQKKPTNIQPCPKCTDLDRKKK
jgi:hypothetical protein